MALSPQGSAQLLALPFGKGAYCKMRGKPSHPGNGIPTLLLLIQLDNNDSPDVQNMEHSGRILSESMTRGHCFVFSAHRYRSTVAIKTNMLNSVGHVLHESKDF